MGITAYNRRRRTLEQLEKSQKEKNTEKIDRGEKDMAVSELSKIKARDARIRARTGETGKFVEPEKVEPVVVDNAVYEAKYDEAVIIPPEENIFMDNVTSDDVKKDGGLTGLTGITGTTELTEEEQKVVEKRKTARTRKNTSGE